MNVAIDVLQIHLIYLIAFVYWRLVEKYEVDKIYYFADKNVLGFSWKSQSKMRTYKNAINAAARKS